MSIGSTILPEGLQSRQNIKIEVVGFQKRILDRCFYTNQTYPR